MANVFVRSILLVVVFISLYFSVIVTYGFLRAIDDNRKYPDYCARECPSLVGDCNATRMGCPLGPVTPKPNIIGVLNVFILWAVFFGAVFARARFSKK
jgi:hypothetical protein